MDIDVNDMDVDDDDDNYEDLPDKVIFHQKFQNYSKLEMLLGLSIS